MSTIKYNKASVFEKVKKTNSIELKPVFIHLGHVLVSLEVIDKVKNFAGKNLFIKEIKESVHDPKANLLSIISKFKSTFNQSEFNEFMNNVFEIKQDMSGQNLAVIQCFVDKDKENHGFFEVSFPCELSNEGDILTVGNLLYPYETKVIIDGEAIFSIISPRDPSNNQKIGKSIITQETVIGEYKPWSIKYKEFVSTFPEKIWHMVEQSMKDAGAKSVSEQNRKTQSFILDTSIIENIRATLLKRKQKAVNFEEQKIGDSDYFMSLKNGYVEIYLNNISGNYKVADGSISNGVTYINFNSKPAEEKFSNMFQGLLTRPEQIDGTYANKNVSQTTSIYNPKYEKSLGSISVDNNILNQLKDWTRNLEAGKVSNEKIELKNNDFYIKSFRAPNGTLLAVVCEKNKALGIFPLTQSDSGTTHVFIHTNKENTEEKNKQLKTAVVELFEKNQSLVKTIKVEGKNLVVSNLTSTESSFIVKQVSAEFKNSYQQLITNLQSNKENPKIQKAIIFVHDSPDALIRLMGDGSITVKNSFKVGGTLIHQPINLRMNDDGTLSIKKNKNAKGEYYGARVDEQYLKSSLLATDGKNDHRNNELVNDKFLEQLVDLAGQTKQFSENQMKQIVSESLLRIENAAIEAKESGIEYGD